MEDREKQLLKEIWNIFIELKEEPDKTLEFRSGTLYKVEPSASSYSTNVDNLLQKVAELQEDFNPAYLNSSAIHNLKLTIGKEVNLVELAKSKSDLKKSMRKATKQIEMVDLHLLLKKAEDVSNGIEEPTIEETDTDK